MDDGSVAFSFDILLPPEQISKPFQSAREIVTWNWVVDVELCIFHKSIGMYIGIT